MLEDHRKKWALAYEMLRTVGIAGAMVFGTWQTIGKPAAQDFVENTLDKRIGKVERGLNDVQNHIKELERAQEEGQKGQKQLNRSIKGLLQKLDSEE